MFMECDEVSVDAGLWAKVKAGDAEAKRTLREQLTGTVLYVHALSDAQEIVTVREVCSALNDSLTLTIGFD